MCKSSIQLPARINHSDTATCIFAPTVNTTPSPITNDKDIEDTMLPTMLQSPLIKLPRVYSNREDFVRITRLLLSPSVLVEKRAAVLRTG